MFIGHVGHICRPSLGRLQQRPARGIRTAVPQQICGEGDEAEGLVLRKAEERVVERGGSERIPSRVKRARAPRSCRVRLTVRADEL